MPLFTPSDSQQYLEKCERMRLTQAHSSLSRLREAFADFWSDPVRHAQLLADKAEQAFAVHAATGQYIATIAPELIPQLPQWRQDRWTMTWPGDGTLVVAAIPQPEPEPAPEPEADPE